MRSLTLLITCALAAAAASAASPFVEWDQARAAECARSATGNTVSDMGACAAHKIDKALADGLLDKAEADRCLEQGRQRGGRGSAELSAWSTCGLRDRVRQALQPAGQPRASAPQVAQGQFTRGRIERLAIQPRSNTGAPLATVPWKRADIVAPLYAGRYPLLPNRGMDNLRYYAQLPQDLARLCPELAQVPDFVDALPYAWENVKETLGRSRTGDVSGTEAAQLILMFGQMIGSMGTDCDKVPDHQRDACIASQDPKQAVLPSLDAAADANALVRAHGCASPQVRRFTGNLTGYLRNLRLDSGATTGLPAPDTPAGAAYLRLFDQCSRQAGGGSADRWCGCHVRQLHEQIGAGAGAVARLDELSADPFVDFSFGLREDGTIAPPSHFRTGVRHAYPRLDARGDCSAHASSIAFWRQDTLPRTTACLVKRSGGGPERCTYDTAWGSFSVDAAPRCPALIDSRVWGGLEVQCAAHGGAAALAPSTVLGDGIRRFRHCPEAGMPCWTILAVERAVPAGYLPPASVLRPDELPVEVRIPEQKASGSLIGITIAADESALQMVASETLRGRPEPERRAFRVDIHRVIGEDKAMVLACRYRDERERRYWYGSIPDRVARRDFGLDVDHHPLLAIGPPRTWCPAAAESVAAAAMPPSIEATRPTREERARAADSQRREERRCASLLRALETAREDAGRRPSTAAERRLAYAERKHAEACGP